MGRYVCTNNISQNYENIFSIFNINQKYMYVGSSVYIWMYFSVEVRLHLTIRNKTEVGLGKETPQKKSKEIKDIES